ncbi:MAG: GNAT family N-acetyltransferase [bacterium (Candidatus Ratteibacteria) CG_4_10_14_3_um_filter_41_18]|uniref:GNAT family N-acetyltransferase n=4 Tax=Candidatus Ratteibacteria TaxID=2979319 RepID=A0A2M7EA06_9BACT|nr:MAG: GNAT family N-acetyltransferase [Candidatus Omnitrophica bacterium CG1_02_41_171]PIV64573.1 MAG: GNAT family N-acetyltransferase [bacterium (Candidatus Ratteibacteria) CG01_land_8_20_14_3_00_40_19]PIW33275.1 MAG: GNAT family N-acetyltransferase [bacterium (Candidatus Ratteibacteria) CG15_BIG_FIL_POST_REV_8_21_14_020_41_12]PIW74378.1 MAG: GNAT family N-acetyltransferase [bacterium (Candidatus Ratteibacteria) CG_4_8_14_3_um_filter_41_36]PIX76821.1 MAG: GNAT family N-acetyltransferase [bac
MIRKAKMEDVPKLQKLINSFANEGKMLPIALTQLYENLRDFWVYEKKDKTVACCRLHITWKDLGEIRSLAVVEEEQRCGIGNLLLEKALDEARNLNLKKVFALTYVPAFFEKHGFFRVPKSKLPRKIWSECLNCPKFPKCDEIAVMKEM